MVTSKRVARFANDFGWQLFEAEPERYTREELLDLWVAFCEEQGTSTGGFSGVLYWLQVWYVLKPVGRRRASFRVLRPVQSKSWKDPCPGELEGSLEGQRPVVPVTFERALQPSSLGAAFKKLKQCSMAEMRKRLKQLLETLEVPCLKLSSGLHGTLEISPEHLQIWPEIFSNLLHAEELQMSFDIGMYDMHVRDPLEPTFAVGVSRLFRLEVPGVAEKRPSVLRGDAVLVISKTGRFKAYVHRVQLDRVDLSFHGSFDNTPPFEVKFFFTRTPLKLMHRALKDTRDRIPFLYSRSTARQTPRAPSQSHVFTALGELNEEQRDFVSAVVQARKVTQIELSLEEKLLAEKLSADTTDARERRLAEYGTRILYHQTDAASAAKILETGRMFRGRSGALGGGIYFAKTPEATHRKAHSHGPILVCSVKLGRTKVVYECDSNLTFTQLQRQGYDSVLYEGFSSGPEYVVYNFDQVKPLCMHDDHAPSVRFHLPLVLWGPPGTGKTTTLVAAIQHVLDIPGAKVLATAPSNAAADLICEKLSKKGIRKMLRLNGMLRNEGDVPSSVKPFTSKGLAFDTFNIPTLAELQQYNVIVSTCTSAGYLASRTSLPGWFTHVFVDEAAQALEPEVLIPASTAEPGALVVLAGDFKQLGPIIRSPEAARLGLDTPFLDRIVQHIGIDHPRVHTLLRSYRAHPSILHIYNQVTYGGMLRCLCPESSHDMVGWRCFPVNGHPVIFHHVCGTEARETTSPSWSNPDEVEVIRAYVQELKTKGVYASDVGIITPYQLQCKRLQLMCRTESFPAQVGTTEQFQGRESRVILLTTVRSRQENEVPQDLKFALGFVGNEKRSNVALSRARSALVVVGNLRLLSADRHWHKIIRLAMDKGYCAGPPFELQTPWIIDGQASQAVAGGAEQELVARAWQRFE